MNQASGVSDCLIFVMLFVIIWTLCLTLCASVASEGGVASGPWQLFCP